MPLDFRQFNDGQRNFEQAQPPFRTHREVVFQALPQMKKEMTNEVERLVGEDRRITVNEISYSPDLSPCDHFPMMKEPIRGVIFETVDEITGAVLEQLKTLQKNGLDGGVPRLPHRWQSCVRALGDYFEGINELPYKI